MTNAPLIPDFLNFLDHSFSPFHVVSQCVDLLQQQGFTELHEGQTWDLQSGRGYFTTRNHSTIFAFRTPTQVSEHSNWRLVAAHTDSPTFKLKPQPTSKNATLNLEVYGSPILSSWLDRNLGVAGIVYYQLPSSAEIFAQLVQLPWTVRIPSLAIHLDNDEALNPQRHLAPVWTTAAAPADFTAALTALLPTAAQVLHFDLELYNREKAQLWGAEQEYIAAGKIDNLAMVHGALQAILTSSSLTEDFCGVCFFHNEEVGSLTQQGAASQLLPSAIRRIADNFSLSAETKAAQLARSQLISADMAHGVHPNYSDKHDENHQPVLNQGPVLKINSNGRYATTAQSAAWWKALCTRAQVDTQVFSSRNDMRTGSTVGPTLAALTGISTVDVGNPLWSMHSISESSGTRDCALMLKVLQTFFT